MSDDMTTSTYRNARAWMERPYKTGIDRRQWPARLYRQGEPSCWESFLL